MARQRLLRDTFSALETAEPEYRAEAIDEYRELEMLAHAWEHGSVESGVSATAAGRPEEGEEKASGR